MRKIIRCLRNQVDGGQSLSLDDRTGGRRGRRCVHENLAAFLDTFTSPANIPSQIVVPPRRATFPCMHRTLAPEILDSLPPHHPDALHNRRDLRLTNAVLGNHRWLARTLRPLLRPGSRVLELGAGTGELLQRLASKGIAAEGLDLWPVPPGWPTRLWHMADLRTFDYSSWDAIIGNLIFHQFTGPELAALGERIQLQARVIVAAEPARRRLSQVLYRTLAPLLGANHVSLHDAHVSIAAGFRGMELPAALRLDPAFWNVRCATTVLGAYRMVAIKRE
jgi:SAM-dependent methyltransferase